jgi:sulfide:quinone oxidoreductase
MYTEGEGAEEETRMAHVVILGAGLGGTIMAYEVKDQLRPEDKVTVVTKDPKYHFVPSNPWIAVGWREREEITIDLEPTMRKKNIDFIPVAAERLHADENRIELVNGESVSYDYLVIATGPELAFDEIPGLGPHGGHTQSVCHIDHAEQAKGVFEQLLKNPGPVIIGAVQGASCFGPAYEFLFILETALRRAKIRDKVPMTFVTSEPYIGHLGLDGVGDTKGLLESEMRAKHIKWVTSAKVKKVDAGVMSIEEYNDDGSLKAERDLPFAFSMMLPAFRGIKPVAGIEGLSNPRGFTIVDQHQQNPKYKNIFAVGVCVAIPPMGPTPVPVGVPKTGFMIESMVTATAHNIGNIVRGKEPDRVGTWNAVCLADFGDGGVAFVAQPQIPPRNVNWSSSGKWVHMAKIGFEKYFIRKMRKGTSEPFYEGLALKVLGIDKLKETKEG